MYYKKFLLLISILQISNGTIQRDLLLTPKESLQILGRTLYYNPSNYETNGTVPWEETLKHVTFFTLFAEAGTNTNLSDLREYKEFMDASYRRAHEEYPRFGDIITMARGWVEKSDNYAFKEGTCEEFCFENALAIWRVQKIRHRDPQRGFRYEMKFSVTPLDNKRLLKHEYNISEQYIKSFILKDDEYPKSFNELTRRSDSIENFSNERQARIVNHEREEFPAIPALNIGELLKQVPKASSKVGYLSKLRNDLPTTYKPNYRVQFANPEVYESPEDPKTVVTHHFHHHYFMNGVETSTNRDHQHYNGHSDAIRIIEPPNVELLSTLYVLTTTTEAPLSQGVYYMQQLPLHLKNFPQKETTVRPFRQSEQQFEEIHYSEPDPLYENVDSLRKENSNYRNSAESASLEIHPHVETQPQVERPSQQAPNSLIEQLPQPAEGQDILVPYYNEKKASTTIKPSTMSYHSTRRTLLPKNKFFVTPPTTTSSENPIRYATRLSPKTGNYVRSTTEQPILKWKPKLKSKEKEVSTDSLTVQSLTEERVITVTPSKSEFEVLTQKYVSKSISVKVGNRSQEIPLVIETTTSTANISNETEGSIDNDSNENES